MACRRSSTSANRRAAEEAERPRRRGEPIYDAAMTTAPKPRIPGRRFLHSPGPTPLPDAVLHAMSVQPMDLGDPRVDANIDACERGLARLLHTEASQLFLYASNGHGV